MTQMKGNQNFQPDMPLYETVLEQMDQWPNLIGSSYVEKVG